MKREVLFYPDPLLAEKSETVTEVTPELRQLADDMVETMYENDGIGLAAPQVGELVRLITVDISGPKLREDLQILINPEIVEKSGSVTTEEGCLSVAGYRANVQRSEQVTVKAQDLDGNDVVIAPA